MEQLVESAPVSSPEPLDVTPRAQIAGSSAGSDGGTSGGGDGSNSRGIQNLTYLRHDWEVKFKRWQYEAKVDAAVEKYQMFGLESV